MSRRKRRSDNLAPALFPFLAVLLCTIGALVLLLAITVTNSHASAKREAEVAFLAAKDQRNLAQAFTEELENQREEFKKKICCIVALGPFLRLQYISLASLKKRERENPLVIQREPIESLYSRGIYVHHS